MSDPKDFYEEYWNEDEPQPVADPLPAVRQRILEGAFGALRSGGHVAITIPYRGLIKNLALSAIGFERHFAVEGPHIRFFTDAGLGRLASEVGFRDVEFSHYGRAPLPWSGVLVWARKP